MAAPTITAIDPASGASWGSDDISITGSNFGPHVRVEIGGEAAPLAAMISDGEEIKAITPHGTPGAAVDVVVFNVDDDGADIVGEQVTLTDGFTFDLPDTAQDGPFVRIGRELIRLFKRELFSATLPETTAVDYDEDPGDDIRVISIAEAPSLTISGPAILKNMLYRRPDRRYETLGDGTVNVFGPSTAVDLVYLLTLASRSKLQILNMQSALISANAHSPKISMERTPGDPSTVSEWNMYLGDFRPSPPRGGLHVVACDLRVVGFTPERGVIISRTRPVDVIETTIVIE